MAALVKKKGKAKTAQTQPKPPKREEEERMLWDRLPGESDPAWAAFRMYRDMGLVRSTAQVKDRVKKSIRLVHRWSADNRWRERVEAWDAEQDRLERAQNMTRIREMHKRHAATGRLLMGKGLQRLQKVDPSMLFPATCLKFIDLGCKLEARALGEPEEHTQHDVTTREGRPVQYIVFGGRKIEF